MHTHVCARTCRHTHTHTHTYTLTRLGPTLGTSFCLKHLFKDVISKHSHILSTEGVRTLTQEYQGDTVHPTSAISLFDSTAPISTPSFSSEMITLCCDGLDISFSLNCMSVRAGTHCLPHWNIPIVLRTLADHGKYSADLGKARVCICHLGQP